jgi:hypothetical protein
MEGVTDKVIIEVLNVLGHVTERHCFNVFPITIGRGYDNDLILSDAYVSPAHTRLTGVEDGGWHIEDLNSTNGVYVKRDGKNQQTGHIRSGDEFVLGRTRLRIVRASHPVEAAYPLPAYSAFSHFASKTWVTALIAVATVLFYAFSYHLLSSKEVSIAKLIAASLPPVFAALMWAGLWAFVGRVIKHQAYFNTQFTGALLFTVALLLIQTVEEYALYNSGSSVLTTIIESLLTGLALAALFTMNLKFGTNALRNTRIWGAHGVAWGVLVVALFLDYAQEPDFSLSPSFPSILKPPFAKLAGEDDMQSFLTEAEEVFTQPDVPPKKFVAVD